MVHPDEYADIRSALDYAELAMGSGDGEGALAQAREVLARLGSRSADDLLPAARLTEALALEATGRMHEAIEALEGVVANRDAALHWARAAMTLAWCYRESGELEKSVGVGERISRELSDAGLGDTDDAIKLQVTLAAAYWAKGDIHHAKRICRRAIQTADRTGSPTAQASAYWNTSVFESHDGGVEAAIPLTQHALSLLEGEGDHSNVARLRSLLGLLFLRRDPPDVEAAIPVLEQAAQELEWSRASPVDVGDLQVSLASARFFSGDIEVADALLDGVFGSLPDDAPFVKVAALVLRGRIQASRGSATEARITYRNAVFELTAMGADQQAAKLWFELGTVLAELGELDDAREAFKRAAATTGQVQTSGRRFVSPA